MTVTDTSYTPDEYDGNGSRTNFPITFQYDDESHIVVKKIDTSTSPYTITTLTNGTHYNITSGAVVTTGGNTLTSDEDMWIGRETPMTQPTDFRNLSSFDAEDVEASLDRTIYTLQENENTINRSMRVIDTESAPDTLPTVSERANKYLAFDTNGDPIASTASQSGYPVTAWAATLLDDSDLETGIRTLGMDAVGVPVEAYGAVGDGSTDDTSAIQSAINDAATAGGGVVLFGPNTYLSGQLTIKTGVILRGAGSTITCLKLADNTDDTFIETDGFSTLTGQDKWLVSDGVIHGFGLIGIRLDCNKANQTAGNGLDFYGKRFYLIDVILHDAYAIGLNSEASDNAGQSSWVDLPESIIDGFWIRSSGSHGWQMRGPHDAVLKKVVIALAGGDGLRVESDASTYSGACDIGFVHIYSCTGQGFYSNIQFRAKQIISENNGEEGAELACDYANIGILHIYENCSTSGSYQVLLSGDSNIISGVSVWDMGSSVGGMQISGDGNMIGSFFAFGSSSTGTALSITDCNYSQVESGHIISYNGVGGIGLKTNDGGAGLHNTVDVKINNCSTIWNNAAVGNGNTYRIRFYAASGQTEFTGSAPNTSGWDEIWDVYGSNQATTTFHSSRKKVGSSTIDLNSTTEQSITVAHGLITTPQVTDIQGSINYTGSNTTWALQYLYLSAVDGTNATFKVKLSTAAGSAETANLLMHAHL